MADGVLNASFLIIEGQPMDICWGLDLMGQHGCSLSRENLKIGGRDVPALDKDELPKDIETLQQHGPIIDPDSEHGKMVKKFEAYKAESKRKEKKGQN